MTRGVGVVVACLLALATGPARAGDTEGSMEERLRRLEDHVQRQEEELRRVQEEAERAKRELAELRRQAEAEKSEITAAVQPSADTFRASWKDGLRFETPKKDFQMKIGGRIQNDWVAATEDDDVKDAVGEIENGTKFRRARLSVEGMLWDRVEYKAQYDFAGGDADFKDVYIGLVDLPYVGGVRVGQQKEPFSLEEIMSSNYLTFMERGLPSALVPSRSTGFMLHDAVLDERLAWAGGVFRDADDFGDSEGDGGFNFTGRLTGLPWYEEEGRRLLHLGAAYSYRNPDGDTIRFRSRPETSIGPRFVDTADFEADSAQLVGIESALVYGPASLQGEYVHAVADAFGSDPDFRGWYVYGSYFLTGEHRPYNTSAGAFDKVKPRRPFLYGDDPGWGAWEIGLRYSQLDLDDAGIGGGELDDVTFGLNWHLNTNTRVMANYVYGDLDDIGAAHILQMRFQVFL